ncbi:MAG TPA: HTTM domain-containing protein, partial [Aggregatilineales bacterium]|nr:HTTM domain-containing protein [Aggregatilineales bacterium]
MRANTRDPNSANPRFWFGQFDSRPVSVFRITFCLVLLKVALYHLPFTDILYTDAGLYPRSLMLAVERSQRFSIMDFLGESWSVYLFWIVWIVVILLLLVGYRARLMSILSFIFLVSVHERNSYVLSGADVLMRVICFWMMFMPLAQYYSIDAVRRRWHRYRQTRQIADLRVEAQPRTTFAFPVRALQVQFSLVYFFSGLTKLTGAPWWSGDALYYALSLKTFALPLANWFVANVPYSLIQLMNYIVVIFETSWIFLVFLPVFQPAATVVALVYLGMMHIGIGLMMSIPDFSIVMLSVYPLFFKASWLERIDRALRAKKERLSILQP